MAKYRAPVTVEPVAIALPIADTIIKPTMCNDRSFVLAEVQVTQREMRKVANYLVLAYNRAPQRCRWSWPTQTGAVSHSVLILP